MGMDVYGNAPSNATGEYFRRNVWGWRPLADLVCEIAPETTSACKGWHYNDGDGLDAAGAIKLADELDAALADGRVLKWISARNAAVDVMPNESCRLCLGDGIRDDDVGQRMGQPTRVIEATTVVRDQTIAHPRAGQTGGCNGCDGRGWNPPTAASYGVDADDVREFANFARASGGFKIL